MRDHRMHCDAIVTYRPTDYSFEPVYCGQVVGIRSYQSAGPLSVTVAYCAIKGHEDSVRRRFAEGEPLEPRWLHEDPEYADPITMAKAAADR